MEDTNFIEDSNTHWKEIFEHLDTPIVLRKACTFVVEAHVSLLHELHEVKDGSRGHGGAVADAEPSEREAHRLCVFVALSEIITF